MIEIVDKIYTERSDVKQIYERLHNMLLILQTSVINAHITTTAAEKFFKFKPGNGNTAAGTKLELRNPCGKLKHSLST